MPSAQDTPVQSYFNSVPGTPRSGSMSARSTTSLSGAELYRQFMSTYHEAHRRLRKPQPYYGNDAAGLTNSQRESAPRRLHKKPGTPPPDNFTPEFRPSKRFIEGVSFKAAPQLLEHTDSPRAGLVSQSLDSGMLALAKQSETYRPSSATGTRPCLRINESSFKSSMQGSGLTVIAEAPIKRPIRKAGTAAPTADTKPRVMVYAEDLSLTSPRPYTPGPNSPMAPYFADTAAFNTARDAVIGNTWARQAYEAGIASAPDCVRPSTAPASSGADRTLYKYESRARYVDAHSLSNLDVYRHRHTGGICPAEYKFDDSRMAAPQLVSPRADSSRESYYAARLDYAANRVRALTSLKQYA